MKNCRNEYFVGLHEKYRKKETMMFELDWMFFFSWFFPIELNLQKKNSYFFIQDILMLTKRW